MNQTIHGHAMALDRTSMRPEDIMWIIRKGAYVNLGENVGREFLCFYSPHDRDVKVALVSKETKQLISVWNKDFHFPAHLRPITNEVVREAKKILSFAMNESSNPSSERRHGKYRQRSQSEILGHLILTVEQGSVIAYRIVHPQPLPLRDADTIELAFSRFRTEIEGIKRAIDEQYKGDTSHIKYRVVFQVRSLRTRPKRMRNFSIYHPELSSVLRAASS